MTAPTLAPPEEEQATRTGVGDEDALREIADRFDEDLPCTFDECSALATVGTACSGCGTFTGPICALHARLVSMSKGVVTHFGCGARGPACDLIRLVPL